MSNSTNPMMNDYMREMQKYISTGNKKSAPDENFSYKSENINNEKSEQQEQNINPLLNQSNLLPFMSLLSQMDTSKNAGNSQMNMGNVLENFIQFQNFLSMNNKLQNNNTTNTNIVMPSSLHSQGEVTPTPTTTINKKQNDLLTTKGHTKKSGNL